MKKGTIVQANKEDLKRNISASQLLRVSISEKLLLSYYNLYH